MSNNISIADIKFKNSLKKHNIIYSLIEKVAEKIKLIPQYEKLRVEIELVKTVANIVENMVSKKNKKAKQPIDKKQLVVDALSFVFSYSEPEKQLIISLIDYLFNNDQIKRMGIYKLTKNYCCGLDKQKISKIIIKEVTAYLVKEYDKIFIIFTLYSIKFKLIIFPLIYLSVF